MNLNDAMFTALVQDRTDFVQLFLDNGVDLKKFLTVQRLRDLYDDVVNDKYAGSSADLLRHLLQQVQQSWLGALCWCCRSEEWRDDLPNLLYVVGRVINYLTGEQSSNIYSGDHYVVKDKPQNQHSPYQHGYMTRETMGHAGHDGSNDGMMTTRSLNKKPHSKVKRKPDFENPEHELFLWATLLNRKELARLFWKQGRDHIGAALTGCALLKALADKADKEEEIDLSNELMQNSEEFEQLAVGTLSECYQRDKSMAHRLLIRELDSWGKTTTFTIADSAEQMDFMGHTSCQTKLNKIWKGKMALYTSYWKILFAMFIPIMIPLIKFSTNETSVEQSPQDGREEQHVNGEKPNTQNQIIPQRSQETKQMSPSEDSSKRKRLTRKLYKVAFSGGGKENINFFNAIYYFHTAPVTKFFFHTFSYLVFLLLFSFFLLTDLHVGTPGVIECVIWGWTATLLIEEVRQVMTRDPRTFSYKMSGYFSSLWNKFDVTMYLMLIISVILRLTLSAEQFTVARIFYALTLSMFFVRFMHTFFVHKQIGPKVIMIRKMMTDLAFFVLILAVFMFSYGVASYVLRFPNTEPRWGLFYEVIYMPYWQLYGELFLEELEGEVPDCTTNRTIWINNPDVPRCPEKNWVVILLFAVYMILAVILLLNLLIAMFSYTFERVQENSEKVWRYYRYNLIHEYFDRPTLAPPLIIFNHIKRMITYIIRTCKGSPKKSHDFMEVLSDEDKKKMTAFERSGMENYLLRSQKLSREHIDAKVTTAGERIDKIIEELEEIKDHMHSGNDGAMKDSSDPKASLMPASLMPPESGRYDAKEDISLMQSRISGLEQQLEMQAESMNQMLQILRGAALRPQPQHAFRQVQPTVEIQDMTPPNL